MVRSDVLVLVVAAVEGVEVSLPAIAGADLEAIDLVGEAEAQIDGRDGDGLAARGRSTAGVRPTAAADSRSMYLPLRVILRRSAGDVGLLLAEQHAAGQRPLQIQMPALLVAEEPLSGVP